MNSLHFDKIAEKYDYAIPEHIRDHYLNKRIKTVREHLKRGLIVDIGCGTGKLGEKLVSAGYGVIGVDVSGKMLAIARGRLGNKLVMGFADRLPLKSGAFDLAQCIALLHHLVDRRRVAVTIKEIARVTKLGGTIIIWDHNPNNPYWPIIMKKSPQDCGEERLIPLGEILGALRKSGIAKFEVCRRGFIPDFVPRRLLPLFQVVERVVEKSPVFNRLCAHNVIIAHK